jgi:hypothetical protein
MQLGPASGSPLAVDTQRARHHPELWMRDLLPEVPRHAQRSSLLAGEQWRRTWNLQVALLIYSAHTKHTANDQVEARRP